MSGRTTWAGLLDWTWPGQWGFSGAGDGDKGVSKPWLAGKLAAGKNT